jgi:hypothetical protein
VATLINKQGGLAKDEGKERPMQVLSYQKHIQSLKKIKPGIKIEEPWRPSFSLSKRLNKYHKCTAALI